MNPWLSEQLAQARRDDWLRAAAEYRRAASSQNAGPNHLVVLSLARSRARVGSLLIRAGERVSGRPPLSATV